MAHDDGVDRPNTHHWPPILYAVVIALAWGLQRAWPIPALWALPLIKYCGWALFGIGIGIGVAALLRFHTDDTPFDPTAPARNLATGGIYRFTRNPMYLGAIVAFVGLGVALNQIWLLLLQPPLAYALVKLAIEREEAYLTRRFGDGYRAYMARVRRWL